MPRLVAVKYRGEKVNRWKENKRIRNPYGRIRGFTVECRSARRIRPKEIRDDRSYSRKGESEDSGERSVH